MRTFKEVYTEVLMHIISHYQKELNISEDCHFVEPRPTGILDLEEKLLRRELILAANNRNGELVNKITDHLSKAHDLVLFGGYVSMIRLAGEQGWAKSGKKEPLPTFYLPINENGRKLLQFHADTLNRDQTSNKHSKNRTL